MGLNVKKRIIFDCLHKYGTVESNAPWNLLSRLYQDHRPEDVLACWKQWFELAPDSVQSRPIRTFLNASPVLLLMPETATASKRDRQYFAWLVQEFPALGLSDKNKQQLMHSLAEFPDDEAHFEAAKTCTIEMLDKINFNNSWQRKEARENLLSNLALMVDAEVRRQKSQAQTDKTLELLSSNARRNDAIEAAMTAENLLIDEESTPVIAQLSRALYGEEEYTNLLNQARERRIQSQRAGISIEAYIKQLYGDLA